MKKRLNENQVEASMNKYGKNVVTSSNKNTLIKRLYGAFINPFTLVLIALATVSAFTDIIFAEPGEKSPVTALTFAGIATLTIIPFTPLGAAIGLISLPAIYFAYLSVIIVGYMILATIMKKNIHKSLW